MPKPNSTSAPVDGVVVLAPRTPVEGFDALLLDEIDTVDVVDVDGSVTVAVSAVEDCMLVDCDEVSLDVVSGMLLVDVVLLDDDEEV